MTLSFDTSGNLHETVELSFDDFQKLFGTNAGRKEKIKNAVTFFRIFSSCGCEAVYIGGSFVSNKKNPEDIDLCFDMTKVDHEKLNKEFPEFFGLKSHNNIGTIRKNLKCHIFTFDNTRKLYLQMLERDRDQNPKGLVKISFKNGFNYD
jgi:hypothetical protein